MDSSVSPEDEIWFLRVCHHISTGLYLLCPYTVCQPSVGTRGPPTNYDPLRSATPRSRIRFEWSQYKFPFNVASHFSFNEKFFLLPAKEIWNEKASCNPCPSKTEMLKQFRKLNYCLCLETYITLQYEIIYQLDAIEYLFVFFQLDMFRAYTPIFRSNGCYNFFTYTAVQCNTPPAHTLLKTDT